MTPPIRLLAASVLIAATLAATPQTAVAGHAGITELSRAALSDRLLEITVHSAALDAATSLRVLLPRRYAERPGLRYPVIYLLHGGGDTGPTYRDWTDKGGAEAATADLPVIVVMPHARNGWYSNWLIARSNAGRSQWESYHIAELVPWIDQTFRTRPDRAVAGLSMGGFGALSYAARHRDLFVAAASFSGAVDTNLHPWITEPGAVMDGGIPSSIWGPRATDEWRWRAHNPWDQAEHLRGLSLTLTVGTGDGSPGGDLLEAVTREESISMHQRLTELGIDHTWRLRTGTHSWPYWAQDLRDTLPTFMTAFDNHRTGAAR